MSIEVEKMTVTLEGNVSSYEAAMNRAIAITEKVESTIKGVTSKINALMGKLDVSAKLNVDSGSIEELKAKLQEADGIVDAEKSKLEMLVNRYNYVLSTLGKSSAGDAGKDVKAQTKVYNDAMANAVSIQKQLDAAQKGGTSAASGGGLAGQLDIAVTKASALSLVITELVAKMTLLSGLAKSVASSFGAAASSYATMGGAAIGGATGADAGASTSATAGAMTAVASSTGKASGFAALFSKSMASAKGHVQGTNFYSSSLLSKIGKIIQRFLIFKVVRSIFMGINEAFKLAGDNSEKTAKAFSQIKTATTNIQNAFAVAFLPLVRVAGPILEWLSRKFVDLGNIVAQFMAALTGQTSYQKAEYAAEKWSSGVEKNAKKAKKALNIMGFDELNILKKPDASSGGGTTPRTGIAKADSPIDPKIAEFAERFRAAIEKAKPVLDWFWGIIEKIFKFIIDNKEKVVIAIIAILGAFLLFKTITTIVSLVTNPIFWIVIAIAAVVLAALWLKDNWQVVLEWLKQAWENIKTAFFNVVNFIWGLIVDFVNIILEFGKLLTDGIWALINFFVDMVVGFFKFLIDLSKTLWNFILDAVKAGWNAIKSVLSVVGNWFKGIFESAWNGVKNAFANVKSFFTGVWTGIKDAFNSVVSWLGGVFSNAWQAIKDAFNGVGAWFGGLWDTIVGYFTNVGTSIGDAVGGAFKGAVNGVFGFIERTINGFIGKINNIIDVARSFPGLGGIGHIREISLPRLASGTVVEPNNPYVAMLGDNRQEQEIVSPMSTMVEAFKQAAYSIQSNGGSGNSNGGSPIIIQFGSRVIREITVEEQRQAALQSGRRFVPA